MARSDSTQTIMTTPTITTPTVTTATITAIIAACGLAVAAPLALGQGPLSEPFPAALDASFLAGDLGFRLVGEGGRSTAIAGDINGDGIDDMIVGMHYADVGGLRNAGAAAIVFGRAGGFPAEVHLDELDGTNGFRLEGAQVRQQLGYSVSGVGDINGDGLDDVVVAALGSSPYIPEPTPGGAFVVFGRRDGFAPTLNVADLDGSNGFKFDVAGSRFERTLNVSTSDLNGDGLGDLLLNVPSGFGVVLGNRDGFAASISEADLDGEAGFIITRISSSHGAGDVNGDGFEDLIGLGFGGLRVVLGREAFPSLSDVDDLIADGGGFRIAHPNTSGRMDWGYDRTRAGDVNGDGVDDLVIGLCNDGIVGGYGFGSGQTYVLFGRRDGFGEVIDLNGLPATEGFRADGQALHAQSGRSVGPAGDLNGDGFDDVVIGAPYHGSTLDPYGYLDRGRGAAYVVFGGTDTPAVIDLNLVDGERAMRIDGPVRGAFFGWDVEGAGDVNGDGVDDALFYDFANVFVLYGRALGCPADLDQDGALTIFDFLQFGTLFDAMDPRADFDGDGAFTVFDFLAFQNAFDAGCP